jgi:hypothetical protein
VFHGPPVSSFGDQNSILDVLYPCNGKRSEHILNNSQRYLTILFYLSQHVVREALKSAESQAGNFKLAPRQDVLPTWPRRGQPGEMDDPGPSTFTLHSLKEKLS